MARERTTQVSVGGGDGCVGPVAALTSVLGLTALMQYQGRLVVIQFSPAASGIAAVETDEDCTTLTAIVADALDSLVENAEPDPEYRHLKRVIHAISVAWTWRRRGNHVGSAVDLARILAWQGSERVKVIRLDTEDPATTIPVLTQDEAGDEAPASPTTPAEVVPVSEFSAAIFNDADALSGTSSR